MTGFPKPPPYASEAEMCAQFIGDIGEDWTAYPETAGWDILLVRVADGYQIGIEAKLKLNATVLRQALDGRWTYFRDGPGPDCRAVLVPEDAGGGELGALCPYIGITIIRVRKPQKNVYGLKFTPDLPKLNERESDYATLSESWYELCPLERCRLPEYVPDVAAGRPAPVQLTSWKIAAIKIAVLLERRGYVTRSDFKALRIDPRWWIAPGTGCLRPQDGGFVAGSRMPDFRQEHPRVVEQIAADYEEWSAKLIMQPRQLVLGQA